MIKSFLYFCGTKKNHNKLTTKITSRVIINKWCLCSIGWHSLSLSNNRNDYIHISIFVSSHSVIISQIIYILIHRHNTYIPYINTRTDMYERVINLFYIKVPRYYLCPVNSDKNLTY